MTPNLSHVAGLELAKKAMEQQRERYGGVHKASLACLEGLIEVANSAPAEPVSREAVAWRVTGRGGITVTGQYPEWAEADCLLTITPLYTTPPAPDAELVELKGLLPALDDALEDLELHGRHSDQGYRKLKDWYRKAAVLTARIDASLVPQWE